MMMMKDMSMSLLVLLVACIACGKSPRRGVVGYAADAVAASEATGLPGATDPVPCPACPAPPPCPACSTCPACGPRIEAALVMSFVRVDQGDAQTFVSQLYLKQDGAWTKALATAPDGVTTAAAEPVPADWNVGESILKVVKANPNNVGSVLAGDTTWEQKGNAAFAWTYGPVEDIQGQALFVFDFKLLE